MMMLLLLCGVFEDQGHISTYIMVFKVDGTIIMDESFIDNDKYEGVEFV